MPYAEFVMWQAFMSIEPIGGRRIDFNTAMVLYQQAALNRGKDRSLPDFSTFMPDWWRQGAAEKPKSLAEKFKTLTGGV